MHISRGPRPFAFWTWNTNRARSRRLRRATKHLHKLAGDPQALQEAPRVFELDRVAYANCDRRAALLFPEATGAGIRGALSDFGVSLVAMSSGVCFASVYLPDSGKSFARFADAVDTLENLLQCACARFHPCKIVLVGDFNVALPRPGACVDILESFAFGPWGCTDETYSERTALVCQLCARFDLHFASSFVKRAPDDAWTRVSWDGHVRTAIDHVVCSRSLSVRRWLPLDSAAFLKNRRRLWGDHRPIWVQLSCGASEAVPPKVGIGRGWKA